MCSGAGCCQPAATSRALTRGGSCRLGSEAVHAMGRRSQIMQDRDRLTTFFTRPARLIRAGSVASAPAQSQGGSLGAAGGGDPGQGWAGGFVSDAG